jgi:hypothetical protein
MKNNKNIIEKEKAIAYAAEKKKLQGQWYKELEENKKPILVSLLLFFDSL